MRFYNKESKGNNREPHKHYKKTKHLAAPEFKIFKTHEEHAKKVLSESDKVLDNCMEYNYDKNSPMSTFITFVEKQCNKGNIYPDKKHLSYLLYLLWIEYYGKTGNYLFDAYFMASAIGVTLNYDISKVEDSSIDIEDVLKKDKNALNFIKNTLNAYMFLPKELLRIYIERNDGASARAIEDFGNKRKIYIPFSYIIENECTVSAENLRKELRNENRQYMLIRSGRKVTAGTIAAYISYFCYSHSYLVPGLKDYAKALSHLTFLVSIEYYKLNNKELFYDSFDVFNNTISMPSIRELFKDTSFWLCLSSPLLDEIKFFIDEFLCSRIKELGSMENLLKTLDSFLGKVAAKHKNGDILSNEECVSAFMSICPLAIKDQPNNSEEDAEEFEKELDSCVVKNVKEMAHHQYNLNEVQQAFLARVNDNNSKINSIVKENSFITDFMDTHFDLFYDDKNAWLLHDVLELFKNIKKTPHLGISSNNVMLFWHNDEDLIIAEFPFEYTGEVTLSFREVIPDSIVLKYSSMKVLTDEAPKKINASLNTMHEKINAYLNTLHEKQSDL